MNCSKCKINYKYDSQNICILHSQDKVYIHLICESCESETLKILTLTQEKEIKDIKIITNHEQITNIINKLALNESITFFDNSNLREISSTKQIESAPAPFIDTNLTTSLCHYESTSKNIQIEVTARGERTNKAPIHSPVTTYNINSMST